MIVINVSKWNQLDTSKLPKNIVIGIIAKLNSTTGNTLSKDPMFETHRINSIAEGFIFAPYFWYLPTLSGKANFDWLVANMPAEYTTVFIDIEDECELSPEEYGKEFNIFYDLCRTKWHAPIYTAGWFLPYLTPWPTGVEYWWSFNPDNKWWNKITWSLTWEKLITILPPSPPFNHYLCPGIIMLEQFAGDTVLLPGSPQGMDLSKWLGTKEEYSIWIKNKGKYMANNLGVPHVSQIISGALLHNNDCGAASVLMILLAYGIGLGLTVDQIFDLIMPSGDGPLSIGGLQGILASKGIKNEYKADGQLHDLFDLLVANRPAIALIHYAPLVDAHLTEKTGFRGAHFVVVIGMDNKFVYIHDPYSIAMGIGLAVPIPVFLQCWSQCSLDGNPNNAYISMNSPIGNLTNPPAAVTKYIFGVNPSNGVPVLAVNIRSGPSQSYNLVGVLEKAKEPYIYIIAISGDYGQLADKRGWVYISYFTKTS